MHNECRCSLIHDMTYLWTCIRVSWVDQRHYSPITIIGCWCGLVVVHAFPLAKSQDEQAMSWACCSQASWGVCSATRHWCSSQIACPYFQCHSSKGFHHRYLDPLVGHRDNHTELRPEMVSFCERYAYSIQMACPYRPCHLSKGLHHPYSYALDR